MKTIEISKETNRKLEILKERKNADSIDKIIQKIAEEELDYNIKNK